MPVYLDTSALAKWYLNESGSEAFSEWIQDQQDAHISSLTVLEFRCLLRHRKRQGDFTVELEQQLYATFESDVEQGHLILHPINDEHVTKAIPLLARVHPTALRTLDAMHLRIALDIGASSLATADRTTAKAAAQLGFEVFSFAASF